VFLRFVVLRTSESSGVRDGLFGEAYALQNDTSLSADDQHELADLLSWFEGNLKTPDRFNRTKSKGYYRRTTHGISWLKATAPDHVIRMRRLAALLTNQGHVIEVIKTDRPGYILYEDNAQVVAEPFNDTPT